MNNQITNLGATQDEKCYHKIELVSLLCYYTLKLSIAKNISIDNSLDIVFSKKELDNLQDDVKTSYKELVRLFLYDVKSFEELDHITSKDTMIKIQQLCNLMFPF